MENERGSQLRHHIEQLVRSRLGGLESDISQLQREVNESFTRVLECTDSAAAVPESDEWLGKIEAEVNSYVNEAAAEKVRFGSDIALLRDSVAELDAQHTQAEVLNTLVARAASFAPRVVLYVVKGANALAWAARGFDEGVGNNAVRGSSVSLQANTILHAAMESLQSFHGAVDQQPDNHLIFSRFGTTIPARVLSVPLKVRGKSAAVLYADSADRGADTISVEAIELMVHAAALVVEIVSLRARMSEGGAKQAPAATAHDGAPEAKPTPATEVTGLTGVLTMPPTVAAQVEAAQPIKSSGELRPPVAAEPAMAPPAAAMVTTPEPVAAVVTERPGPPRGAVIDEDQKAHNDARRFARLLVSEIKLYNEQKVIDGRRSRDLYDRLKDDIDRSRQMYEKRVAPLVAAKFDYFYDELVNVLGEGDASKLGSDCPGPVAG